MNVRTVARAVVALVAGYGVIVAITSFGFNVALGGRTLFDASPATLLAGTAIAVIAGFLGGFVAGVIGPFSGAYNAALVLVPLAIDTTYVLFFFTGTRGPFWFDALGSATLMVCTLAGGLGQRRFARRDAFRTA